MTEYDAVDAIIDQWSVQRPDLETDAMEIYGRIYRLARAMGDKMEATYAPYGIDRGTFDVLAALRRAGEPFDLSPGRLATSLMLTTGGMTGRLDKLQRAGLIERVPDPADRRALRARLTDKGRDVIDRAVAAGVEVQRASLEGMTTRQRQDLADMLRDLLARQ
jgi:DNA-binding MarR family transcriptional regulator